MVNALILVYALILLYALIFTVFGFLKSKNKGISTVVGTKGLRNIISEDEDEDVAASASQFTCSDCNQSFLTEMMQKYHECPNKKEEQSDFKCPDCGKSYWSQRMLSIHQKTHIKFDDDDGLDDAILNMKIEMPKVVKRVQEENDDDDLVSSIFKFIKDMVIYF